jgi:hypothetical protein
MGGFPPAPTSVDKVWPVYDRCASSPTERLPVPVLLHDPVTRESIRERVKKVRPASTRQWGKMSPDQMLWHVNQLLAEGLGQVRFGPFKPPLPFPIVKFIALNFRWPKGVQTRPDLLADGKRPNLEAERALSDLLDAFAAKNLSDAWPPCTAFGKMSGKEWSQLTAKHMDHHLKQFGV